MKFQSLYNFYLFWVSLYMHYKAVVYHIENALSHLIRLTLNSEFTCRECYFCQKICNLQKRQQQKMTRLGIFIAEVVK